MALERIERDFREKVCDKVRLQSEGVSPKEIARQLDVDLTSVKSWLKPRRSKARR